ncbi:MAG: hypothetical protein WKG07_42755 [Hymenobacter sp.]
MSAMSSPRRPVRLPDAAVVKSYDKSATSRPTIAAPPTARCTCASARSAFASSCSRPRS